MLDYFVDVISNYNKLKTLNAYIETTFLSKTCNILLTRIYRELKILTIFFKVLTKKYLNYLS